MSSSFPDQSDPEIRIKTLILNQIKNDPGEFDPFVDIDPKTDQNDPNWIKSDP